MAGRPLSYTWDISTFTGPNAVSRIQDNFNNAKALINDSGAGWTNYAVDTGSANNYAVTLASAPLAYTAGMMVCFKPANTNTGASNINVNSLGSISIVNPANIALNGGEIAQNQLCSVVFDGTSFRIIGACPLTNALAGQSGTIIIECAGFTSVSLSIVWTGAATMVASLRHIAQGIPINHQATN